MFGGQAERFGEFGARLDQAYSIRISAGTLKLGHARSGVQREAHPAVGVRWGASGTHDPRGDCLQRGFEPSEVRRNEFDVCSTRDEETFSRPIEPGTVEDTGSHEYFIEIWQQRTKDVESREVLPSREGVKELPWNPRTQGNGDAVDGAHDASRLGRAENACSAAHDVVRSNVAFAPSGLASSTTAVVLPAANTANLRYGVESMRMTSIVGPTLNRQPKYAWIHAFSA